MPMAAKCVDPAFDAHIGPLKHRALAWWQNWQPADSLTIAIGSAAEKVLADGAIKRARVAGPAGAAVASAARLGWYDPRGGEGEDGGDEGKVDATFTMLDEHMMALAAGTLNP